MLIVPDHVEKEIRHQAQEEARKFARERIDEIVTVLHNQHPTLEDFYLLITAKPDLFKEQINTAFHIFDEAHKPPPIQGGQLWHIIWSTGFKNLEWCIPLQRKKQYKDKKFLDTDLDTYAGTSILVRESLAKASKYFGRNFLTGKKR